MSQYPTTPPTARTATYLALLDSLPALRALHIEATSAHRRRRSQHTWLSCWFGPTGLLNRLERLLHGHTFDERMIARLFLHQAVRKGVSTLAIRWNALAAQIPELRRLEREAIALRARRLSFRRRYDAWYGTFKPALSRCVGWYADDGTPAEFRTIQSYDSVYSHLRDILFESLRRGKR